MTRQIVYTCGRLNRDARLAPDRVTVWWTIGGPVAEIRCECGDWHYPDVCGCVALALILAGADAEHEIPEMADRARGSRRPITAAWVDAQQTLMDDRPGAWAAELVLLRDLVAMRAER